jgi:hypothetical protein
MAQLGRESGFAHYVSRLRAAHKAKRKFMKLLDQETLTARLTKLVSRVLE